MNKQKQVDVISKIFKASSDVPMFLFKFGKHKDRSLEQVLNSDPNYLIWCYEKGINLPTRVMHFIAVNVMRF